MKSVFDLDDQHGNVDSKIASALERLSQAYRRLLWEENEASRLSPIQTQFLVYCLFHPPQTLTIGKLATYFDLTPATVSDAVRVLEEKGLLLRQRREQDKRVVALTLTKEGRETAEKLSRWANVVQESISKQDEAQKVATMEFLMRLIMELQQAGVITVARMCRTCRFFARNVHTDALAPHHCRLVDAPLAITDLRMDCPEHERAE